MLAHKTEWNLAKLATVHLNELALVNQIPLHKVYEMDA
jgi:hypothetical protein